MPWGASDLNLTEDYYKELEVLQLDADSSLCRNQVEPSGRLASHCSGARLRAIDDDWHRVARQRTVIQAVLDRIKSASVTELNDLLDAALPVVQTNFTKTEIAALM